ncbi:hypothetical protein [Desulfobacter postgatei]|uniref:hypothetical protein n=1 Tax=Desulfobacter postgatei TaxID=2293 RepID=UPI001FE174A4|nr:hypothetical protein [Desulfobacter postgatei]
MRPFTGWIYDFIKPYADDIKVAHPEMLKAITAAKKKTIYLMPRKYVTFSELICYRNVIWLRASCEN